MNIDVAGCPINNGLCQICRTKELCQIVQNYRLRLTLDDFDTNLLFLLSLRSSLVSILVLSGVSNLPKGGALTYTWTLDSSIWETAPESHFYLQLSHNKSTGLSHSASDWAPVCVTPLQECFRGLSDVLKDALNKDESLYLAHGDLWKTVCN